MNTYYSKWKEQEESRASQIDARRRQKNRITAALAFVLCVASVAGIGFLGGGAQTAVSNIKYGVILGVASVGIFLIVMLCGGYRKRYMKVLQKEVDKELTTDALKEEFAMAMLDKAAENSCFLEFVWQKWAEADRFCVADRFAVLRGLNPCIVQLDKIERMELEVMDFATTSGLGDYKVRVSYTVYPIFFYYKRPGNVDRKKQKADKMISFPSKELRDRAIHMMQEAPDRNG